MNLADRAMAENGRRTLDDDRQRRNDPWRRLQPGLVQIRAAGGPFS
ncbi:hypothetical protein [Bradyrhizobium sp. USDA 4529]